MQSQIPGRAAAESITFLDGRCIFSVVPEERYGFLAMPIRADLDGIVDQLRVIDGIDRAIFYMKLAFISLKSVSVPIPSWMLGQDHGLPFMAAVMSVRAGCTSVRQQVYDVVITCLPIAEQLEQEKANA